MSDFKANDFKVGDKIKVLSNPVLRAFFHKYYGPISYQKILNETLIIKSVGKKGVMVRINRSNFNPFYFYFNEIKRVVGEQLLLWNDLYVE